MNQFVEERRARRHGPAIQGGIQHRVQCPKRYNNKDLTFALDGVLADDTTIFTSPETAVEDEQHIQQVFARWGEDINTDKTERMPLGITLEEESQLSGIPAHQLQTQARFLGAWISSDASQRADTDKRLRE